MNDRQSIIGFTEAELGLFLAVIFLILAVASRPAASNSSSLESLRQRVNDLSRQAADANKRADAAEQRAKGLGQAITNANNRAQYTQEQANELSKQLSDARQQNSKFHRSNQRPTCREKSVQPGAYLFQVNIVSAGFEVSDKIYAWDELLHAYTPQLQQAKMADCSYTVKVYFDPEVSSQVLAARLQQLNQTFIATPPRQSG